MTRSELYNLMDQWRDAEVEAALSRRKANELLWRLRRELDEKYYPSLNEGGPK